VPNRLGWFLDQRFYASTYGRFLTADPSRHSGGTASPASWNKYAYTRGDPVNRYDPQGLMDAAPAIEPLPCVDCGGGGGGCGIGGGDDDDDDDDDDARFRPMFFFCPAPEPEPAPPPPTPNCASITAAVGFSGLTYANASEIWTDGGLSAYSTDSVAATIAALAAVTWQGESSFSLNPINNPNTNAAGVVTSVDYGPFQINQGFHPNSNGSVWGTNGAGQVFNGNPDANITFGISILEGLYNSYGNNAAGRYVGSLGTLKNRQPTSGQKRENTWNAWKAKLIGLFSNTNCFPHP
jgi:RHS repeat-associated protein